MSKAISVGVLLISLMLSWSCHAQLQGVDYEWVEKRDRDGIQIFTSSVPDSPYKAVRGEMVVNAKVAQLVALVNDLPRCPEWADLCEKSRHLEQISDQERIVHIHNNIPFPIKDRDVVARMRWSKSEVSGGVTMHSQALKSPESHNYYALQPSAVRIYEATTQWHFTPMNDGLVKVENFAHINPNGPTPAWLTNMLLVSSPFKTMESMRAIVEAGEYLDAELMF
jgi:ribosome-associated toxin RatA of RatAB toxin-antitoxin module